MNAKTRAMLVSGLIGATVGALAGLLYYNSAPVEVDEEGREHLPAPKGGEAVKLSLAVLGVLRTLSS